LGVSWKHSYRNLSYQELSPRCSLTFKSNATPMPVGLTAWVAQANQALSVSLQSPERRDDSFRGSRQSGRPGDNCGIAVLYGGQVEGCAV